MSKGMKSREVCVEVSDKLSVLRLDRARPIRGSTLQTGAGTLSGHGVGRLLVCKSLRFWCCSGNAA